MSRVILAAAAASLLAGAACAQDAVPGPVPPEADRAEARAIFKELVEINTTHSHGSTAAAEAIRARLLAAGFAPGDVVFLAPPDKPTKGNLVVRYRGRGEGKPVLFMGHLDVVEARPEDWSVDPFKLTEKDGYFYGRGAIDMKDGDAVLVDALIRLKRQGYKPARDLIVMFTADEEAGGDANGPEWLLKTHRDLIDAERAYNFDGGGGATLAGKRLFYSIGTSEKVYLTFTAEATGPGGHGSLPGEDNPIYRIADALGRLEAYRFPAQTSATTRASFAAFAELRPGPESADMMKVSTGSAPDEATVDRLSKDPFMNAQLRTTCVATLMSGGHAENALPQRAKATIQCRLLPSDTAENVKATLVKVLADPKITLTQDAPPVLSPESPPTPQEMARIGAVVHSMWPGVTLVPTMSTGFSDDRQTRAAGIPSYDVGGAWVPFGENRAHGRDERIGVQAFDEEAEYAYRLLKAIGG
ncbi:MAG: M20/M25/M40 family metallo-hydrolase [Caulobacteraceae bacterium]|nr:M20/M25/M40 family metallo-hydrolase [Caulobacteraceae bacterium]